MSPSIIIAAAAAAALIKKNPFGGERDFHSHPIMSKKRVLLLVQ